MIEGLRCTAISTCSMLTLSEKALLVKLYYENEEPATKDLWSYRSKNFIRKDKVHMVNLPVKRMISKFVTKGSLDDRPRNGRPSTNLALKLLPWSVRGMLKHYRITSFLNHLMNTSWKARLLCRMTCHPILLDKWKIFYVGHLVIIEC